MQGSGGWKLEAEAVGGEWGGFEPMEEGGGTKEECRAQELGGRRGGEVADEVPKAAPVVLLGGVRAVEGGLAARVIHRDEHAAAPWVWRRDIAREVGVVRGDRAERFERDAAERNDDGGAHDIERAGEERAAARDFTRDGARLRPRRRVGCRAPRW